MKLTLLVHEQSQQNNQEHKYMKERIERLEKIVSEIRDNHLGHLKQNINDLRIEIVGVKTDVKWLKKTYWIVVTASVGGAIAAIIPLLN